MTGTSAISRSVALRQRGGRMLCLLAIVATFGCGRDDEARSSIARPRLHFCEVGMTIFFGLGGDSERIRRSGWSYTEQFHTWSDGHSASLGVHLPHARAPIQLHFKMAGFAPPALLFQPVEVYVNSEHLVSWEVSHHNVFTVTIPARLLAEPPPLPDGRMPFVAEPGARLIVEFRMPRAASPKQLGHGEDPRLLGVQMTELHISGPPEEVAENLGAADR